MEYIYAPDVKKKDSDLHLLYSMLFSTYPIPFFFIIEYFSHPFRCVV